MSFDILQEKIREKKNPTVAGLDARIEYVPVHIQKRSYEEFGETLAGAAELMLSTGRHPGMLKDEVCSPGGSTIAGVHALESRAFRSACIDAVNAAFEKTKQLGQK